MTTLTIPYRKVCCQIFNFLIYLLFFLFSDKVLKKVNQLVEEMVIQNSEYVEESNKNLPGEADELEFHEVMVLFISENSDGVCPMKGRLM